MPREFKRTDRVADQIQRELAWLLQREIKDPRVGLVTISDVRVSRDMGYAEVYFTLLSTEELNASSPEVEQSLKVLQGAAGFLRSALGRAMKLRIVPHLRFHFDALAGESRRLDALINRAVKEDGEHEHGEDGPAGEDHEAS
ncbi:30S ribosome-binding factor RbfA [Mangrovitalea sediminis]|uniref:30S ribosome-binding factor RbfA n=1 Tax=Mangrovitalea sediminis TaxID=1982043 RepID=UPI000BE4E6D2|nr:30S ribosome-binding factor RbfA [Mangrovitalea sediminis]